MRTYRLPSFGLDNLRLTQADSPEPQRGQAVIAVKALSLNYRDLLVIEGRYNPKLPLPATPISDAAGVVVAVGAGVSRVKPGDAVVTHFVTGWLDGPFRAEYPATTLGLPGPGLAAEYVALSADALLPAPTGWSMAEVSTLPIAALTAWSALVTEGKLQRGQWVLTLGTGGVSIFALQLAKALGARVIITSSDDAKLARAAELGADHGINYRTQTDWERRVLELTGGGVDVVVENGGAGTLSQSIRATRAGGTIAFLGAMTGLTGEVNLGPLLFRRIRIAGVMVDSRAAFEQLLAFLPEHRIRPVIDTTLPFDALPEALRHMRAGRHFGKIVVET